MPRTRVTAISLPTAIMARLDIEAARIATETGTAPNRSALIATMLDPLLPALPPDHPARLPELPRVAKVLPERGVPHTDSKGREFYELTVRVPRPLAITLSSQFSPIVMAASKALQRPVRGPSGTLLAIVAARYCAPLDTGMRPAISNNDLRRAQGVYDNHMALRNPALPGAGGRHDLSINLPDGMFQELVAECASLNLAVSTFVRLMAIIAVDNVESFFPSNLLVGPDVRLAYENRPLLRTKKEPQSK